MVVTWWIVAFLRSDDSLTYLSTVTGRRDNVIVCLGYIHGI